MTEIWKDIEGFEGKYRISNTGKVLSLNYRREHRSKILLPKINPDGYAWVQLWFGDGRYECKLIHRLVADAFLENPKSYPIINHKDENPLNNNVENLEWCDNSYNVLYSLNRFRARAGYAFGRRGKRTNMRILQITLSGKVIQEWPNSRTIQARTGMSDWSISECCRGKRHTAYGFKWRYKDAT